MRKRAIFSLTDRTGVVGFARKLLSQGWEIIASKETAGLLKKYNVPVTDIGRFFNVEETYPFPPTLHPSMELGLTTNRGKRIDLVYITTYPLSEGNDVGGHTILALAAKGNRIAVSSKEDMADVVWELAHRNNTISSRLRDKLRDKAFAKAASHYKKLSKKSDNVALLEGKKIKTLYEGENPYQRPAELFDIETGDGLGLPAFEQIQGSLPCYTNTADLDHILHIICVISETFRRYYGKTPYISVAAKHGNPCGLAVDWNDAGSALEKSLLGRPVAIFGGEVITNFRVAEGLARKALRSHKRKSMPKGAEWSLDLIAAPGFSEGALVVLSQRKRLKIFKNRELAEPRLSSARWAYRMVRGGFLRQPPNDYILSLKKSDLESLSKTRLDSMIIAWCTAWNSFHGGNEIAIAKDRMLIGAGGGPATVDACSAAVSRAKGCGHDTEGSVFAADAFFPFTDAPQTLIAAGCGYGIVPSGGRNFTEVKAAFKNSGVKVFYLPERFRGFYGH